VLHCHLRSPVPPVALDFNHGVHPQCVIVPNFSKIGNLRLSCRYLTISNIHRHVPQPETFGLHCRCIDNDHVTICLINDIVRSSWLHAVYLLPSSHLDSKRPKKNDKKILISNFSAINVFLPKRILIIRGLRDE